MALATAPTRPAAPAPIVALPAPIVALPSPLAWLRPPPLVVPDVLSAPDVGPVAWQALLRDRVTRLVFGEVAIAADRPESPAVRATAALPLVPPRGVIGRAAAVWVHAGGPRPERIDVMVAANGRRPDPHPLRVPHECALPECDVVGVGPLRVTSVERTAVDVARWLPAQAATPLLARLADRAGLDPGRALGLLATLPGHRGKRVARSRLRTLKSARLEERAAAASLPQTSRASPVSPA